MDTVEITIPVSRVAAERLSDSGIRARLGALLSLAARGAISSAALARGIELAQAAPETRQVALRTAIEDMRSAAAGAGLTPDDVEEELAAWKAERSSRLPRS